MNCTHFCATTSRLLLQIRNKKTPLRCVNQHWQLSPLRIKYSEVQILTSLHFSHEAVSCSDCSMVHRQGDTACKLLQNFPRHSFTSAYKQANIYKAVSLTSSLGMVHSWTCFFSWLQTSHGDLFQTARALLTTRDSVCCTTCKTFTRHDHMCDVYDTGFILGLLNPQRRHSVYPQLAKWIPMTLATLSLLKHSKQAAICKISSGKRILCYRNGSKSEKWQDVWSRWWRSLAGTAPDSIAFLQLF